MLKDATGSWHAVFLASALGNFLVVVLALFVLRPLRSAQLSSGGTAQARPAE
jgi:MFS transporter, OFA family, oxalate/formate antiporter